MMKKPYQKPEVEIVVFNWNDAIASCGWSIAEVNVSADDECSAVTYVVYLPDLCTFSNVTGS